LTLLRQSGLEIDLQPGWEGRILTRPTLTDPAPSTRSLPGGAPGEHTRPILHAGNFALPAAMGDYGSGAVELMRNSHAFVTVIDFGPEAADTPLFARRGIPRPLAIEQFDPLSLQRTLPGQSGTQQFFTAAGRGFCLYVVLGSHLMRPRLVALVNQALRSLRIS
jgi:hypothetical protein